MRRTLVNRLLGWGHHPAGGLWKSPDRKYRRRSGNVAAPFIKTGELRDGEIIVQESESRYRKNSQKKIVRKKNGRGLR
jgi:hypothetical protein